MSNNPEGFISIGNDQLGEELAPGQEILCRNCNQTHPIQYARDAVTGQESDALLYVKCGDKAFLVGVDGKRVLWSQPN